MKFTVVQVHNCRKIVYRERQSGFNVTVVGGVRLVGGGCIGAWDGGPLS